MEKRFTRIIWNESNWEKPSGHRWNKKNQNKNNLPYEKKYGFGHDEWLFNPRYRVRGYQYGYIRGVGKAKLENDKIDELYLFTKDNNKKYWFIGMLRNVIKITDKKEEDKIKKYLNEKYSKIEIEELKQVEADYKQLKKEGGLIFNVKFKWEEAEILEKPIQIEIDVNRWKRYLCFKLENADNLKEIFRKNLENRNKLVFSPGKTKRKKSFIKENNEIKIEITSLHVEILEKLYKERLKEAGKQNLSMEKTKICRKFIDLLEKTDNNEYIFYEVKTHRSGLMNIRNAIGQLLEYALLDKEIKIKSLVIVGPVPLNETEKNYLKRLNNVISIPIEYWYYDSSIKEQKFIKNNE